MEICTTRAGLFEDSFNESLWRTEPLTVVVAVCLIIVFCVSCMLGVLQLSHDSNLYSKNSYLCDSLLVCLFW